MDFTTGIISPYLYRVSQGNISEGQNVYLFGTCHNLKKDKYPSQIFDIFKQSSLLISEFPSSITLVENRQTIRDLYINIRGLIQHKFLALDKEWFTDQMIKLGKSSFEISSILSILEEKSQQLTKDSVKWQSSLSEKEATSIQIHLDDYGVLLENLDPFFVEEILVHKKDIRNYTSETAEVAILQDFKERQCSIIELDDDDCNLLMFLDSFLQYIEEYEFQETLENIIYTNQQLNNNEFSDDDCETDYEVFTKDHKFFQLQEENEAEEEELSTIYRNKSWPPKVYSSLDTRLNALIVCGYKHLLGKYGMVNSFKALGCRVEHVKQ